MAGRFFQTAKGRSDPCPVKRRLFVRQTNKTGLRIFPALNIKKEQMQEGFAILDAAIAAI